MSEPTSIKNLRDLVSPTTLGTFHVEPAAVLSAYDTMKMRAEAAEARRDVWELRARKVVQERRTLRVERDALRKVYKAAEVFVNMPRLVTESALRDAVTTFRELAVQP